MNTFLMGLVLLASTTAANAQVTGVQAPRARSASETSISVTGATAPSPALASVGHGYSYSTNNIDYVFTSGKDFKMEDLKSKEVSKEIAMPKGGEIYIENTSRGVVIKTWDQPKVKVTTTVYYDGEPKLTDEEWFDKLNLSLKTLGTSVKVKSGGVSSGGTVYSYNGIGSTTTTSTFGSQGGAAIFNSSGQNIGSKSTLKRTLTITVPAGSKIDVESKYSDITLPAGIGDVNLDISNSNLESENLNKLTLRSKYSNINVGDIKVAEVEFTNGRFTAKNIDDLDIESKSSTIEMASAKKIVIRSSNDEYELEEAGEVRARKSYGNLRITKLNNSLEVDGSNADVKVRKVGPALSLIKIDDKYADVRIPLRETKNYAIDFTGNYSSVYGNFEKVPVPVTTSDKDKKDGETYIIQGNVARNLGFSRSGDNSNPSRFTATVGDGKGLKVEMKCQNCTVDFK
ncbi:DUF4097 domain-containing protein [Sediminibacterium roseum]|uniref:DUF4097 domain-containing protein n=1 Tax=Sediminibacterium roseum TaxID=1978412 RepID=A0ABW9ZPS0_9BACT|nr:DUF4097 domain-containing protein [Sediminibacterium roseum]NCI48525.1 DUF4097 domain-containing protein [Sediminibacterium roseum]